MSFKTWVAGRLPPTPDEVDELLTKIPSLLTELKQKAETGTGSDNLGERLKSLEGKFDEQKKAIATDGKLDREAWQGKTEEERRVIGNTLVSIFHELMRLNQEELRAGQYYFVVFFVLLVAVTLIYASLHWTPRAGTVKPTFISDVSRDIRSIELEIGVLRKTKAEGKQPNLELLKKYVGALRAKLQDADLDVAGLQLLGMVEAEAERGDITESDTFGKFSRVIGAEMESLRVAFLWNDRRGRWLELAWWAEIGVIVGILFYIAGRLSRGSFARAEIAMFWTEVVIAPIVVLVIFFLFALTGITGISPTETSITGNVGFAFIFGFAIRRTLGLLDIIKKRIFPEPVPAS